MRVALVAKSAPTSPAAHQPLLLGTNIWPGYEPFYLARAAGFLDDSQVRLAEFSSTSEVMRAFQNGSIQLAATTLDEALLLAAKEVAFKVILVADVSAGGDGILARPIYPDLASLRGKRIGLETTALGGFLLHRALELRHLNKGDFTLVSVSADRHQEAYLKGMVEAIVTFEPCRSQLLALGAREVFSSRELPGEVIDILIANPEALQTHPQQIQALLKAWFQAVERIHNQRSQVEPLIADRMGIPLNQVGASFNGLVFPDLAENLRLLQGEAPPLANNLNQLSRVMREMGLLTQPVDLSDWIDVTPLQPMP